MGRARRPNEPSSYQTQPEVPPELTERLSVVRAVIGERMTISEAAEKLSIARVNMQTLVHRVEAAIIEALQPRPTGPTAKPEAEKKLSDDMKRLSKENEKLKTQLQAADEMMMAAGEIIRALRGLEPTSSRTSSSRSKRRPKPSSSDEDPEPVRWSTLRPILSRVLERLRTRGDAGGRIARMLDIAPKTLRRWLVRLANGEPLFKPRGGVMREGPPHAEARVRELVTSLHGLAGAKSLARSVEGVSRRRAGVIKKEVVTAMERERKAQTGRVEIINPGSVRGFDAMYLESGFALVAADASVPFRTTVAHVTTYDAQNVAAVLEEDFRIHGAPLVLRCDRARCHSAEPVASVLRKYGVLALQGPPYYAPYNGQLERQNLEHRQWCASRSGTAHTSQRDLDQMKSALNEDWLRPTLNWRSAAQCWAERPTLDDDRDELHREVLRQVARLCARHVEPSLAMRLAIEQALTQRGHLRVTPGRKALCE